jgi:hypothetical protein
VCVPGQASDGRFVPIQGGTTKIPLPARQVRCLAGRVLLMLAPNSELALGTRAVNAADKCQAKRGQPNAGLSVFVTAKRESRNLHTGIPSWSLHRATIRIMTKGEASLPLSFSPAIGADLD